MGEVDPAFIQDLEHRPSPKFIEAGGIPLIDLSAANSPDTLSNPRAIAGLVAEIGEACENWGFFQVINHGVPAEIRERIENAAREFFAQPAEEKRKVRRDERQALGYYDTEHTKNVRDWKEVIDFIAKVPTVIPASHEADDRELKELVNQWPEYPPDLREVCEEYGGEMEKLAFKLLGLISLSLGLPADRLNGFFEDHTAFMRLNHYPPCPAPHLALGIGRHKDSGALTVLAQDDVGGLEVKRKADGVWVLAKTTPDAYIINVGDIVQGNYWKLKPASFCNLRVKFSFELQLRQFEIQENAKGVLYDFRVSNFKRYVRALGLSKVGILSRKEKEETRRKKKEKN